MKIICTLLITIFTLFIYVKGKSQDYARHIELSLLFYEAQRSGKLPEDNRIFWRHDSLLDAGKDVGLDLSGGYYDAGDNVKYNFPMAGSMTLLAWSGIEFADGYKKAEQWEYLLKTVKWGTDYFIKCHPEKNVLYVGVGDGVLDHARWFAPEYINYEYPSFKVDAENPGSDVAGETAAALAAASILFKEEDSSYSATLLKHAKEIYDFADTYRGDYSKSVPSVVGFYSSFSGFIDELAWGAAWLYYATGDDEYLEKYSAIADAEYQEWDKTAFPSNREPISWDDKRPGAYILISRATGKESYMELGYKYCDAILNEEKTPGGLYYNPMLSMWASNRYAANAASMVAMFANILPESDPKRKSYIDFVKGQIDYILGDNPEGINFVVGAEDNSPKAVHHRGASGAYDCNVDEPAQNIFTLYGALAGGPDSKDAYEDTRKNFQMNEVALDYNAGFTLDLAALIHFGYGVKDSGEILDFPRAWPPKPPTPDISVSMSGGSINISTDSGMQCSSWCVFFNSGSGNDNKEYSVCNTRETNYLDGKGTPQKASASVGEGFEAPKEFKVLCNGYGASTGKYNIDWGQMYKVTSPGGPSNTEALDKSKCLPSFLC